MKDFVQLYKVGTWVGLILALCLCASVVNLHAQGFDAGAGVPNHVHLEGRHWPEGCEAARAAYISDMDNGMPRSEEIIEHDMAAVYTDESGRVTRALPFVSSKEKCGEKFYEYDGHNLLTSAGQTAISQVMSNTSAQPAAFNYIALTNTAITPAVGDTTLSGEIAANGLSRAQGTFTDTSAALGAAPTPASPTTVGTSGAATLYYWIFPCTAQGCTAVGSSSNLTTANATLTTGNYVSVTWTGKVGASYYVVVRTQGSGAPSGANAGGSAQATTGAVTNTPFCSVPVAGSAPTCTIYDQSNNTTAFTVPASDQTFVGKHTLTKTFTNTTANQAAQAFGIFNNSSAGTMLAEGTFTPASLAFASSDTLAFTWTDYH